MDADTVYASRGAKRVTLPMLVTGQFICGMGADQFSRLRVGQPYPFTMRQRHGVFMNEYIAIGWHYTKRPK